MNAEGERLSTDSTKKKQKTNRQKARESERERERENIHREYSGEW